MPPCSGCGLETPTGTEGCQAIFDELSARALTDISYGRIHRLVVDVYCLQHPDRYMVSAKSAAAHLLGVCVAVEKANDSLIVHMIHKWLNGPARIAKPVLPDFRGASTIADIASMQSAAQADPAAYARAVRNWARTTWSAYTSVHPVTRDWLREMLQ